MDSYLPGQQHWAGGQEGELAYPPAMAPAGWQYPQGHQLPAVALPAVAAQTPLPRRPPVLPPGELDTVTGPISLSTSARRDQAAVQQPSTGAAYGYGHEHHAGPASQGYPVALNGYGQAGGHGYPLGYAAPVGAGLSADSSGYAVGDGYPHADDVDYVAFGDEPSHGSPVTGSPAAPAVPVGTTFIAATPAARSPRRVTTEGFGATAGREGRAAARPGAGSARARGEKTEGQRTPGAHRAPVGRPGSARAKLAIASTASLAGLSALVGSAVLATDTGPLTIPPGSGNGTSTGQFPVGLAGGADGAAASDALAPITPGLTPTVPDQSGTDDGQGTGDTYYDAGAPYDLATGGYDPTLDGAYDPLTGSPAAGGTTSGGIGDSGEILIVPLLPRDGSSSGTPAGDSTAAAPSAQPSTSTSTTGNLLFDWFGLGGVPDSGTGTPSPSPQQDQPTSTPPVAADPSVYPSADPTTDPTTDPSTTPTPTPTPTTGTGTGTGTDPATNPSATSDAGTANGQEQTTDPAQSAAGAAPQTDDSAATGSDTPPADTGTPAGASDTTPIDPITVVRLNPLDDASWSSKATIGWFS